MRSLFTSFQNWLFDLWPLLRSLQSWFGEQSLAKTQQAQTGKASKTAVAIADTTKLDGASPAETQQEETQQEETQQEDIQREIRAERTFSLAEAIGREGGSFMKGESAIPRPLRAVTEINQFIASQQREPSGALATTLYQWASTDIRLSRQLDTPLVALAQVVSSLLSEQTIFNEFFRQVAIAHSQITGDRPHFQQLGQPPHPAAAHTHDSVQQQLSTLLQALQVHQVPEL